MRAPHFKRHKDEIVPLEFVCDPIGPLVTFDGQGMQDVLVGQDSLVTLNLLGMLGSRDEQGDRHLARFKDVDHTPDQGGQIGGQLERSLLVPNGAGRTVRAESDVGLEGSVGRVLFGGHVDGPVASIVVLTAAGHDGIGRVAARLKRESVEFGFGKELGKAEFVGESETERVAFVER